MGVVASRAWIPSALLVLLACSSSSSKSEESTVAEITKKSDEAPTLGPEGGGFRSNDGVVSLFLPPGAVDRSIAISIVPNGPDGNGATYRIAFASAVDGAAVKLAKPAMIIMDLSSSLETTNPNLRLAQDGKAMRVHGRASADSSLVASLQYVGITWEPAGDVGVIEVDRAGRAGGPLPACIEKCFEGDSSISAIEGGGCSVDALGPKAQSCVLSCDAASLSACTAAPSIDCGGTSCASCCLQSGKLTCDPACTTGKLEGKVTVDCLVDKDCGGGVGAGAGTGLSCCVPPTVRGGGTLIIKDTRITCRASCGGEQLHLCDVTDPNRCSSCEPARKNCTRGFCGADTKAAAVVCPN